MSEKLPPKVINDKLDYACGLIELCDNKKDSILTRLQNALSILEFGGISAKEMMEYLESSGR